MITSDLEANNRLYTIKEAREWTQLSDSSIRRHIKSGEFPHVKLGTRLMVPGWFLSDLVARPTGEVSQ